MSRYSGKFSFIALLLISIGSIASGAEVETRFAQLKYLYDKGTTPTQAELTGWFTGRCFSADAQNKAINQLLVGDVSMVDGDGGPLFPGKEIFKAFEVYNEKEAPDYFDVMNDEKRANAETMIASVRNAIEEATVEADGALASLQLGGNWRYSYKKSGDFFIGRDSVIEAKNGMAENDTLYMCYYFKRVN